MIMNISFFLPYISIKKTERSFASAKAVLVFSRKFPATAGKPSFSALRNIFLIGHVFWNLSENIHLY